MAGAASHVARESCAQALAEGRAEVEAAGATLVPGRAEAEAEAPALLVETAVLARGAAHAHEVAAVTYERAADAMGLLPPVTG